MGRWFAPSRGYHCPDPSRDARGLNDGTPVSLAGRGLSTLPSPPLAGAADVDFARDVRPALRKHRFRCHGEKKQEGGLRLDLRSRALAGGDTGPAVVPGKPEGELLRRVTTRDRVIGAVNDDLPFDQFSVEQLADDLLPGATAGQYVAGAPDEALVSPEGAPSTTTP